MNIDKFKLTINASVIDALMRINDLAPIMTLFVVDENEQVLGTLTDGDIRRGLIKGYQLNDKIDKFINTKFGFLIEKENNFEKIKHFRNKKLKAVPVLNKRGELIKVIDFSNVKSILPIDAVIMAGGKGLRLRPLTEKTPKPLLKIGNKEIIAYNFDRLFQFGIENQFVTVNYLADEIATFCANYKNKKIDFKIIHEDSFLGTAGSLSFINNFEHDIILLINSDILTNIDYEDFFLMFSKTNADMMAASIPYEINLPYAIFETLDSQIHSFKEKPSFTYYANAGIYLIKKELLKLVPKQSIYNATDLMNDVNKHGFKLLHYPITGYWLDIGKMGDFERAQKDISHIDFD